MVQLVSPMKCFQSHVCFGFVGLLRLQWCQSLEIPKREMSIKCEPTSFNWTNSLTVSWLNIFVLPSFKIKQSVDREMNKINMRSSFNNLFYHRCTLFISQRCKQCPVQPFHSLALSNSWALPRGGLEIPNMSPPWWHPINVEPRRAGSSVFTPHRIQAATSFSEQGFLSPLKPTHQDGQDRTRTRCSNCIFHAGWD